MSNDTMSYEFAPALGQFAPATVDADVPQRDPFIPLLDAWHEYLRGGATPPFSGRNNLKAFAMLSAAIGSVESGERVEVARNPKYAAAFGRSGS
jgi:predicted dehydrogenase